MTDIVDKEETSLQDDVRAAMEELNVETPEVEVPDGKTRGPDGKFVAKEAPSKEPEKKEVAAKEATKEPVKAEEKQPESYDDQNRKEQGGEPAKDPILTQDKPPIGWTPKMRERWGEIPEDVRGEIIRREEASVQGVRQLHEQFEPVRQFAQELGPYIKEALENNTNPGQYIGNVMQAERSLRVGTDQERFAALVDIAEGYGIPLRTILNEALGTDVVPQSRRAQIPAEVQRELEESRRFRQQIEEARAKAPVEDPPEFVEFAKTHEFFEDVREQMAYAIQTQQARTLEEAYELAIVMNKDVRELLAEREAKNSGLNDKQRAALGAKVKGGSNVAEVKDDEEFDDGDDTAATIRKAMAKQAKRI